jgi:hypothetical protein
LITINYFFFFFCLKIKNATIFDFNYGLRPNCYQNINWIEDTLIKTPAFQSLSGQKSLIKENFNHKLIIIDTMETSIQRPKKIKKDTIPEKNTSSKVKSF